MKRKTMGIVLAATIIAITVFGGSVLAGESEDQEKSGLPTFHPTIAEMKKYPAFYKPFVPSKPIPESQMTHITFAKDWLLKNDIEPDPGTVKITFPASWLQNPPLVTANVGNVELSVPTRLLKDHNESNNPDEITVSFPNYYFKGLPAPPVPSKPLIKNINGSTSGGGTRAIEYVQRMWYDHTAGDDIKGARGRVTPDTHENTEDETFIAYHEIEFGGDTYGDWVEIISDMRTDDADTSVWFALWKSNVWITTFDCGTNVPVGNTANYEFYTNTSEEYTICWLEYPDDTWYMDWRSDSTPPTDYEDFVGSSELDTIGGISEEFYVLTDSVSIESLKTDDWQAASYVNQRLDYDHSSADADYVGIGATLDSSGLFFYEWATD